MILVPPRLARRHCGKASPHSGGTSSGSLRTALAVIVSMAFEGSRDSDLLNRCLLVCLEIWKLGLSCMEMV